MLAIWGYCHCYKAMQVNEKIVKKVISIYEQEYGEKLSMTEGREMTRRLLTFYLKILSPLPSERKEMGLSEIDPDEEWIY